MDGRITQHVQTEGCELIVGAASGSILPPCSFSFKQTPEVPQSVNGVRSGCRPPPFLTKTLIMVEDPETNCIISWNPSGTSFIIWDHLRFAKELLPKYFKHSNFSSFIYQLNNYGFKKIGLRQYEYESKWFQAGQPHLLMNMKRRTDGLASPKSTKRQGRVPRIVCSDTEKSRAAVELENLRESNYLIKLETQSLKQKKVYLEDQIAYFKEQGIEMESKAQKMFMFLGTVLNPSIVQQVIGNSAEEEYGGHGSVKKMWLIAPKTTKTRINSSCVSSAKVSNNNLNSNSNSSQDNPAENRRISSAIADDYSGNEIPGQEQLNGSNSEAILGGGAKGCNAVIKYWQENLLLEGYSVSENEAEQELAHQNSKIDMAFDDMMASKIVMEVEDVIAKEPITDMDDEVTFQLWA